MSDSQDSKNKPKTIEDLNQLYTDAEAIDKDVFAEMRTNILMAAGNHYERMGTRFWQRIREYRQSSADQKIRLTKNHIGRICGIYQNNILSNSPSVTISPKQEKEIQHQKAAELHNSVLAHIKEQHDLSRKMSLWVKDYIEIGELFCKVFWDPNAGIQVGWEPETDEDGQPVIHPLTGQPMPSETPVMSGDLIFEVIHGFDIMRDPGCKNMDDSSYFVVRKMEAVKDLKKRFPDAKENIEESSQDTYRVFNNSGGQYTQTKGLTMVREYYFKKCAEYPKGYYYITTEKGILTEGELPFGIFPIHYVGFDELTTSPRSRSIIRQLRPYQIEINRASSKMAEHQITVGDDKVYWGSGSKPSAGSNIPGVRQITGIGQPVVIPGRTGDQYLPYINAQIAEMYQVANIQDLDQEINGQIDPYTLLFRSIRQKQKFSMYSEKFGNFVVKVHKTALSIFKKYASDQLIIPVIGKNEVINLQEFKNSSDVSWEIKLEQMSDDLETKMGKQITLNHVLQYIGPSLDKKDIGKFMRLSPYLNTEKMFSDMTMDYDNLINDILALDRGEFPPTQQYETHDYIVKGLVSRMKQPDFRYLPPQIQQNYERKKQEHEAALAQQQAEIKAAESGFIPSGGYLVVCDFYVPNPNNPKGMQRVKVPSESLDWLLKKLEVQGSAQNQLQQIGNQQVVSDIARMIGPGQPMQQQGQAPQQMPQQHPMAPQQQMAPNPAQLSPIRRTIMGALNGR